ELEHRILRIALDGRLIDSQDLAGLSHLEIELFQAMQDDDIAGLGVDLLEDLCRVLGLPFVNENLAQADIGGQEAFVPFDGTAKIATGLLRTPPLEELPADFIRDADQQGRFGSL